LLQVSSRSIRPSRLATPRLLYFNNDLNLMTPLISASICLLYDRPSAYSCTNFALVRLCNLNEGTENKLPNGSMVYVRSILSEIFESICEAIGNSRSSIAKLRVTILAIKEVVPKIF